MFMAWCLIKQMKEFTFNLPCFILFSLYQNWVDYNLIIRKDKLPLCLSTKPGRRVGNVDAKFYASFTLSLDGG